MRNQWLAMNNLSSTIYRRFCHKKTPTLAGALLPMIPSMIWLTNQAGKRIRQRIHRPVPQSP